MTHISTATVQTASAKRYLGQFVKHFAHKLPVELSETNETGNVVFSSGSCGLSANCEALHLTVNAETEDGIAMLQNVVHRHLIRFAFREDIAVDWSAIS